MCCVHVSLPPSLSPFLPPSLPSSLAHRFYLVFNGSKHIRSAEMILHTHQVHSYVTSGSKWGRREGGRVGVSLRKCASGKFESLPSLPSLSPS